MFKLLFATFILLISTQAAMCDLTLSPLFSNGAVLQREMPVPVWGTATDGQKITVKFQKQTHSTIAEKGKWRVTLKPLKTGGKHTLSVSGEKTITRKNIQIGEVWICSGQSNMEQTVAESEHTSRKMLSSCNDVGLWLFNVPKPPMTGPLPKLTTHWTAAAPNTVAKFSGVGYFFARELRKSLKVPVGIINITFGGSYIALWMDGKTRRELAGTGVYANGRLYDAMVRPISSYAIRGVIWYQGESDADNSLRYKREFPAMIKLWRNDWGQSDLPFLFVQLPGFNFYKKDLSTKPQEQATWAELREVQSQTAAIVPNTAMVVTTDVGDPVLLHPPRKLEIGQRLALTARAMVYEQKVRYRSPIFKLLKINGSLAIVTFDNANDGLIARGNPVTGFTLAGKDGVFHNASATIKGNTVRISSPKVPRPVHVRYGWANYPNTNLFNKAGLPASPFRTDNIPFIKCSKCRSQTGDGTTKGRCNKCNAPCKPYLK
ncbi:MAG: sialate O-acetylesterase [Lentisphaeria bacterium]|nr:sialate O-acetylesterase [Lentisphaeria bacterium]NQZ70102.1 sialate O-acetylesterase [Lentisphaeria bacterium]